MWWYYKCVNLIKVLIQGSKVILFSIENALQKTSRAGGAPPRTDALIGPAAFGDVQKNGLFKTTRERRASLSSLLQLSGAPELGALKRAQGWPGNRPAGLSQLNQPSEGV